MIKKRSLIPLMALLCVCFVVIMMTESIVYAKSVVTQTQAVQWAADRAKERWEINDGTGVTQCTEFVAAYYEYLTGTFKVYGDARDYVNDLTGACRYDLGWTRPDVSTARPGDIFIQTGWAPGHIGVIIGRDGDTLYTAEANGEKTNQYYGTESRDGAVTSYTRLVSTVNALIRPSFVSITLASPSEIHLNKGKSYQIVVTTTGNGGKVKWSSSDTKVASVSQSGVVKAKGIYMTTVTASYAGEKVKCKIYVHNPSLKLSKNNLSLKVGETKTLKATVTGVSNKVVWKSSNAAIVAVDGNGNVKGNKPGTAKITASANGITKTCKVTVKAKPQIKKKDLSVYINKLVSLMKKDLSKGKTVNDADGVSAVYDLHWCEFRYFRYYADRQNETVKMIILKKRHAGYNLQGVIVGMKEKTALSKLKKKGWKIFNRGIISGSTTSKYIDLGKYIQKLEHDIEIKLENGVVDEIIYRAPGSRGL